MIEKKARVLKYSVPVSDLILYLDDMLEQLKDQGLKKRDVPIIYNEQLQDFFKEWGDSWTDDDTMIVNEERKKSVKNLKRRRKRKEKSNSSL